MSFESTYLAPGYVPASFEDFVLMGIARTYVQGYRSNGDGGCVYEDDEGRNCIVGAMIKDLPSFSRILEWEGNRINTIDDTTVYALLEDFPNLFGQEINSQQQNLLNKLQEIHDSAEENLKADLFYGVQSSAAAFKKASVSQTKALALLESLQHDRA